MNEPFLIDTNIIIYFLGGDEQCLNLLYEKKLYTSFVSEIEVLGFPFIQPVEEKIATDFMAQCIIIELSEAIKTHAIFFKRKYRLKVGDALVVATAVILNMPLITADRQLSKVEELALVLYNPA